MSVVVAIGLALVAWFADVVAAAALLVAIAVVWVARGPIQRSARLRREDRRRRHRRERRELMLEQADACGPDLEHLTSLVERVEREAPHEARCYGLDELLDRYVEIAVARAAYMRQLVRSPAPLLAEPGELVRAVRQRAAAWRRRCTADVVRCDDLLGEIADLIRLYSERMATPDVAHLFEDDVVGRQLETLPPVSTEPAA